MIDAKIIEKYIEELDAPDVPLGFEYDVNQIEIGGPDVTLGSELYGKINLMLQKLRMVKKGMAAENYVTDELIKDFTAEAVELLHELAQ
jgi:hypothetical protein